MDQGTGELLFLHFWILSVTKRVKNMFTEKKIVVFKKCPKIFIFTCGNPGLGSPEMDDDDDDGGDVKVFVLRTLLLLVLG